MLGIVLVYMKYLCLWITRIFWNIQREREILGHILGHMVIIPIPVWAGFKIDSIPYIICDCTFDYIICDCIFVLIQIELSMMLENISFNSYRVSKKNGPSNSKQEVFFSES